MSKIIKQVQLNKLPVVINNLCLLVSDEIKTTDAQQRIVSHELEAQAEARAEARAAAYMAKAKRDMEEQSAVLFKESKDAGYMEGKEQGYLAGKETGLTDGFMQGEQSAKGKMESAIQQATEQASRIIAEANRQAQLTILSSEKQILEIALTISEKILASEINANSQAVVAIVKNAMDKVRNQTQITVRVNPSDFEVVIAAKSELEAIFQREQAVEFTTDQTVSRGGCVIDTAFGSADARLETQLQAVRAIIRGLVP